MPCRGWTVTPYRQIITLCSYGGNQGDYGRERPVHPVRRGRIGVYGHTRGAVVTQSETAGAAEGISGHGTDHAPGHSARPAPEIRSWRIQVPPPLLVAVGYLAVAIGIFHSAWGNLGNVSYGGNDAMLFAWFLGWTPHALADGLNPFLTHHINAPDGADVLWSTPVLLLGALAAPITLLGGPVTTLTVLLTLAPVISGFALFWVLRRWVRPGPAALAGLLYGFGPHMIGASYGHLHLTFAPFPPVLLLLLDDLVVRGRGPRRTGVLLGLAIIAQALIGEELLATSALAATFGLVILAVRHRDRIRSRLRPALSGLATAGGVAAVALAWPLGTQFLGAQRIHGSIQPDGIAVTDLLTFVTPTPMQAVAPDGALRHSLGFTGNAVEVSGYLGAPLIVVVVVVVVATGGARRPPPVGVFAPLGVVMAVLSLGGHLHVDGRDTGVPLPWLPLQHVPVLGNVLPSRLALYVMMCAAIVVATGLDRLASDRTVPADPDPGREIPARVRTRTVRLGAGLLTLAALVALVPAPMLTTSMTTPAFFTSDGVTLIPQGATALVVPFPHPQNAEAMLWQARANFRFVIPGCYCTVPGPDGRAAFHSPPDALTSALIDIDNGATTAAAMSGSPRLRAAYKRLAPDAVVLGPARRTAELRTLLRELVGAAPSRVGGVDLWLPGREAGRWPRHR
ncbi:conserved hypothetical protein [Frankia casuarinae]|uniref:Uncharacterized protein n=1 Tax=Frankia casuarinae (strain DSM 45818 / CECT 9043 / HFP020203 / CcI3) TaxID=106370 RepID=Q2JG43_FRACC|nr:conserved hypothetical protein [Frankia casuarinae]